MIPMPEPREDFAGWLEWEGQRIKEERDRLHGGTPHRMDLIHWADALQWAARKYRDHGHA